MAKLERLQKVLSQAGVASRRKAEAYILEGRVQVNGQAAQLGMKVAQDDTVTVDGQPISWQVSKVTYLLHKPAGYVTTVSDEHGRPTVMDLVPEVAGLHPVGRLDLDSEGLLLLTNDGELTLQLTHPRYEHPKEYRVWCHESTLSSAALTSLRQGVALDDGPARAVSARAATGGCVLVIQDGRNHQVKRMLMAVGYTVIRLLRTRISELALGDLPAGAYRELTQDDYARLPITPKWVS
jgi:23S rRNA pseudouridine2605 synthase